MELLDTVDAALREGVEAHAATLSATERAVVDDVIAAGAAAVQRVAQRPQRTDTVLDVLTPSPCMRRIASASARCCGASSNGRATRPSRSVTSTC